MSIRANRGYLLLFSTKFTFICFHGLLPISKSSDCMPILIVETQFKVLMSLGMPVGLSTSLKYLCLESGCC